MGKVRERWRERGGKVGRTRTPLHLAFVQKENNAQDTLPKVAKT